MKNIAVIGATGNLAPLVIRQLVADGFAVKALVRDVVKAKRLLPAQVELVRADLEQVDSLVKGLQGVEAVYLNLSTATPNARFQPELDGVKNIIEACQRNRVARIFKISGLGAYRRDFAPGKTIFVNEIRGKGHELVKASGIAYSFFHPSWFMESLEFMFHKGSALKGFKPIRHPLYWIAGKDYARMVSKAMASNAEGNKDYVMQGPEAVTMHEALVRYSRLFRPVLKVSEFPIRLIKAIGIVVPQFKLLGMMGDYFQDFKEEFIAEETWAELGRPERTIETFR
ncbi:NAD(P)H-binding protein [Hymenobacter sp. BT664]|uniref:NAD(P)H-binding protein n=1 Tax=Hymenobacter montanus TaxID=2771359 RepID=A0A927BEJ0_9BACT|nr:NAD(P)H-binding protein [Hymenobacter montanus]MBD2769400.1 NAD(P)H-binding protein [Hymenobacter montanus]